MFTNFTKSLSAVLQVVDTRMILFVLMLVLFVIGAGAPGATGLNGG